MISDIDCLEDWADQSTWIFCDSMIDQSVNDADSLSDCQSQSVSAAGLCSLLKKVMLNDFKEAAEHLNDMWKCSDRGWTENMSSEMSTVSELI